MSNRDASWSLLVENAGQVFALFMASHLRFLFGYTDQCILSRHMDSLPCICQSQGQVPRQTVVAKNVSFSEQDNLVYTPPGKSVCPVLAPSHYLGEY